MVRSTKILAVALVCSAGMFFSRNIAAAPVVSTFTDTTGLDLAGNIILAEDTNRASGTVVVGGLTFNPETYFKTSPSFGDYSAHNWGGAVAFSDASLNTLLQTIRYSGDAGPNETSQGPMIANIPVSIGDTYKLQLIFWEGDSSREDWNITIEGDTTLSNFDLLDYTGNVVSNSTGVLVTYEYTATDGFLNVSLASVTDASATSSVMINAFTLELLPVPEPNSMGLLLLGSVGVAAVRRVSKRRNRFGTSRTMKSLLVALVCLTSAMFSQVAQAGTFGTPGVFTSAADLGLTGLTPAQVASFVQAEDSGPSSAPVTVGQITFSGPPTVFTGGHPYSTANFGDANLNTFANTTFLFLASVSTPTQTKSITGLTNGNSYQLQLIFYDGDSGTNSEEDRGFMTITAGGDTFNNFNEYNIISGTTGTTESSPGSFYNNRGAYLNYDFVAAGTSLNLTFTPPTGKYLVLSGYTLQDITPVPEPTSASLLILGCCGVVAARRAEKRRR
jgi:hypothetical protein